MDWGWAFDGVNTTIPRNAGPDCSQYLSSQRQLIESIAVTSICFLVLRYIWPRLYPCSDANEEHARIIQRRFYDTGTASAARREKTGDRNCGGYFGNVAPLTLLPQCESGSGKSNVLVFNDDAEFCRTCVNSKDCVGGSCREHFNNNNNNNSIVNSSYCLTSAGQPVIGSSCPDSQLMAATRCNHGGGGEHAMDKNSSHQPRNAEVGSGGNNVMVVSDNIFVGKQVLLVLMTFVLGLEIGFKFASRTVIYLLNPCHITTIMQIYLLASKPSRFATAVFRIQMNYMNGPMLAFIFPETESRKIPMEAILYWVQHGLMFINSIYLLRLHHSESGVRQYSVEPLIDWTWNIFSYACLMIYHFGLLASLAVPTEVNLNHMLCPALLDPFNGPNYRLIAITHQAILCPLMCKTIYWAFAPAEKSQRRKRSGCISSNDSESSLVASSVPPLSTDALGIASSGSSQTSSPSMEHPIQSLNRTEYLNLINDSEDEEASQRLISYEGDGQLMDSSSPVKRSGLSGTVPAGTATEKIVFNASGMERNFAEFLDKKQE